MKFKPITWMAVVAFSANLASTLALAANNPASERAAKIRAGSSNTNRQHGFGPIEQANRLIGQEVRTADKQAVGKLQDFVVDLESGRILYGVVDTTAGRGNEPIAVPPGAFSSTNTDPRVVTLQVNKQQLTNAPRVRMDQPEQFGSTAFVGEVYRQFNEQPWWEGATAQPGAAAGTFGNVHRASEILKMNIVSTANDKLGQVENVMIDLPAGRVAFVVLDPAGNVGRKDSLLALPPNALTRSQETNTLTLDADKSKLQAAPQFSRNNWRDLQNPTWASQVYSYYGKQPYFQTADQLSPTSDRPTPPRPPAPSPQPSPK